MTNGIVNTEKPSHKIRPLSAAVISCLRRTARSAFSTTGLALILTGPGLANAATFQVMNTNDAGAGSLRQAVLDANTSSGADEILFDTSVSGTLNLSSGPLQLLDSVDVKGPGSDRLSIDAGGLSDIFVVSDSAPGNKVKLKVSGLTLTNATNAISANVNRINPVVAVVDSILSGNIESGINISSPNSMADLRVRRSELSANGGHGISCSGGVSSAELQSSIKHTVISNNGGAGVYSDKNVTVDIFKSEIAGNSKGLQSIGYWDDYQSQFNITESVISGNLGDGIVIGDSGELTLENSSVTENGGLGVSGFADAVSLSILTSTLSGNDRGGVEIAHEDYYAHVGTSYSSNLLIANSTISGNGGFYGGVHVSAESSSVAISNSTITSNSSGVYIDSDYGNTSVDIENAIIAGNGMVDLGGSISGLLTIAIRHSLIQDVGDAPIIEPVPGSNLFGQDPLLGPLQNNGGLTQTHALMAGSPAIDQGDDAICSKTDQRGIARPQDGDEDGVAACDMGAVERTSEHTTGSGVLGDLVWRDDNGDGVQDAGEPGLEGVTVTLRVGCDSATTLSTVTDSSGAYRFENLPTGEYQLQFAEPAGYSFSPQVAAGNYLIDSNADPQTGLDQCRPLKGQRRLALDAGLIPEQ